TDDPQVENGYRDRAGYTAFHFHGAKLADSLMQASDFLLRLEKQTQRQPYPLCVNAQFSTEDGGSSLAWRVTVVLSSLTLDKSPSRSG
ncbi:MAG: hypothetical protein J2P26_02080, partial [Nocardiopsaceae bacterium]|nr:hypothetical protein [Nocardiopsaceae bacterium]